MIRVTSQQDKSAVSTKGVGLFTELPAVFEDEEKRSGNWLTGRSLLRLGSGLLAVAVLATVVAAGGSREKDEPRTQPPRPAHKEVEVLTVHPQRVALLHIIEQSGQIEGVEQIALHAKVSGFVQAYQAPAVGTSNAPPLFEVVRIDAMRMFVDVPELDARWVGNNGQAVVIIHTLGEQVFDGRVVRLSWMLNNQARTLRTEIDFPNPEGRLHPGMYATALLPLECPAALTLPSSAVFQQDNQSWVVCVEGSKAIRTPVRLGVRQDHRVEILPRQAATGRQGETATWKDFTGAELVVRENPRLLTDGQDVRSKLDEPNTSCITQTSSPRKN